MLIVSSGQDDYLTEEPQAKDNNWEIHRQPEYKQAPSLVWLSFSSAKK